MNEQIQIKNTVRVEHIRDGRVLSAEQGPNLVTDAGFDWLSALMGDAAGAPADYIALTSDATAVDAGDTTLTSEYADFGLSRAQGTYAHSAGTKVYTIAKTFTATADSKAVAKAALFNAASNGSMFAAYVLAASVTLMTNDQLTVTWTVTLS